MEVFMSDSDEVNQVEFSDLLSIHTKDTSELKVFSRSNALFAFVRKDLQDQYYLHFITTHSYQFALANQKRSDRPYKIKTFKNIDSAIKYVDKFEITSVTVILSSTEFMLVQGFLITNNQF